MVRESDVEPPVLVKRGERISVHCLSGGVVVRIKARALADAREGELVECRADGGEQVISARVTGRAVAVIDADAARPRTRSADNTEGSS